MPACEQADCLRKPNMAISLPAILSSISVLFDRHATWTPQFGGPGPSWTIFD